MVLLHSLCLPTSSRIFQGWLYFLSHRPFLGDWAETSVTSLNEGKRSYGEFSMLTDQCFQRFFSYRSQIECDPLKISRNGLYHCHSVPGLAICHSVPQFPHLQINSVSPNFLSSRHCYEDEWFKKYKSALRKEKILLQISGISKWNPQDSEECWSILYCP